MGTNFYRVKSEKKTHLGKRSAGWKFLWNFHNDKYYSNKEELLNFIRSGKVIDEYGKKHDTEEFLKMALEWGEPDGQVSNDDIIKDGLRISTHTIFS